MSVIRFVCCFAHVLTTFKRLTDVKLRDYVISISNHPVNYGFFPDEYESQPVISRSKGLSLHDKHPVM